MNFGFAKNTSDKLYKSIEISWLLESLKMSTTRADLEKVLELINKGDVEALKSEEFDQFQYQGFDPMKIVQSLAKSKADGNIDDVQFKNDVYKMVAIGIIKGSVNDHNMTKMSDDGKGDLNTLMKTYGIAKGGGRGKASSVITFPRVMATFPDIAVRLVSVIGPKEFNGGPLLSSRLPHFLKVQVFPAVIPRNLHADAKKMLLTASLCYSIDQTTQISQLKSPDLKQLAATQGNFTMVGHQSPVPSAGVRSGVFKTLKVEESYGAILSVLRDYKEKVDPSFNIIDEKAFKEQIEALK